MMVHFQGSPQTQGVMTRASTGNALHSPGTYQLVMDPRLGLIVGAVTSPQATQGVCGERPSMSSSSFSSTFVLYITVLLTNRIPYEPILY